jgi:hypothetical protein
MRKGSKWINDNGDVMEVISVNRGMVRIQYAEQRLLAPFKELGLATYVDLSQKYFKEHYRPARRMSAGREYSNGSKSYKCIKVTSRGVTMAMENGNIFYAWSEIPYLWQGLDW